MVMGAKKEVKGCLKEKPWLSDLTTRARQDIDDDDIYIHKQYSTKRA